MATTPPVRRFIKATAQNLYFCYYIDPATRIAVVGPAFNGRLGCDLCGVIYDVCCGLL